MINQMINLVPDRFEDTKGVARRCNLKKDRQVNIKYNTFRTFPNSNPKIVGDKIDIPNTYNDIPNTYNDTPNTYIDITNTYIDTPNTYNDTPNTYIDIPNTYIDTPNTYIDTPNTYRYH
jgi:hypothetical protein